MARFEVHGGALIARVEVLRLASRQAQPAAALVGLSIQRHVARQHQQFSTIRRRCENRFTRCQALQTDLLRVITEQRTDLTLALPTPRGRVTGINAHMALLASPHLLKLDENDGALGTGGLVAGPRRLAQ